MCISTLFFYTIIFIVTIRVSYLIGDLLDVRPSPSRVSGWPLRVPNRVKFDWVGPQMDQNLGSINSTEFVFTNQGSIFSTFAAFMLVLQYFCMFEPIKYVLK